MRWRAVVRAKPGIITPSRRRGNHGVHRTDTDVLQRMSGSQQFKPLTLAVIAHREVLPGEPAVEFVCPGDLGGIN